MLCRFCQINMLILQNQNVDFTKSTFYKIVITYSHLPKVLVQTQISTHSSSHLSAYHRKYTLNEVSMR